MLQVGYFLAKHETDVVVIQMQFECHCAMYIPKTSKSHSLSFPILVRRSDLTARHVLKLHSQQAVEIGKVQTIMISLSNSVKASRKPCT